MFFVEKLYDDEYAIIKYYSETVRKETWRYTDTYEDVIEICHYFNGGSIRDYLLGNYKVYEWKLVPFAT